MNEQLAKQILKIFVNNPFDAFNHKQISSRLGAGSKAERQEVIRTIQELAEQKHLIADDHRGRYRNTRLSGRRASHRHRHAACRAGRGLRKHTAHRRECVPITACRDCLELRAESRPLRG